jgi:hypothetical protein
MSDAVLMQRPETATESDGVVGGVPRNLLRDAVFSRLLSSILRGEYRRGQRLRLDAIAADMRVSRTPVREALVPLETLRLVSVQRYVGVVIANWGVENMVERLRILQDMLRTIDGAPDDASCATGERFDPFGLRDCLSEAGVLALMAEWLLRRRGRPVSADWLASQRPALDMFYTVDVAAVHGIDMAVGRRDRLGVLGRAQDAAIADDLDRCAAALDEHAGAVAVVQERFIPRPSRIS